MFFISWNPHAPSELVFAKVEKVQRFVPPTMISTYRSESTRIDPIVLCQDDPVLFVIF